MNIKLLKESKSFGGYTRFFEHDSESTKTKMKFSAFLPRETEIENAVIWLSGLTCNEENFITKSGVQKYLEGTKTMIICPDTSPRGLDLPGEHESYDFGSGAGFYVNATTDGYKDHYRMYDYISKEITSILKEFFHVKNISIMGHSMGGHGALVLGLREKEIFTSVSAFSPIVNPINSAWGEKIFKGYLKDTSEVARSYDATELLKNGYKRDDTIFIDQGLSDEFYKDQLLTENFKLASAEYGQQLKLSYREGYDHSYYYIATFIQEHINFHLKALNNQG